VDKKTDRQLEITARQILMDFHKVMNPSLFYKPCKSRHSDLWPLTLRAETDDSAQARDTVCYLFPSINLVTSFLTMKEMKVHRLRAGSV